MPSFYERRVYDSPATGRMSDLIRQQGQIRANAALQAGAIQQQAWSDVGRIVGQTMGDLVQARQYDQQVTQQRAEARKKANADGIMRLIADRPVEEGAQVLRREGFTKEADELMARHQSALRDAFATERAKRERAQQKIGDALDLLTTVGGAPEADRPRLYAETAPKIREMVGPDLATMVPDQYSPEFMQTALTWGMSAREKLGLQLKALEGLGDEKDFGKIQNAEERLRLWLAAADTPEEWAGALQTARQVFRVPESIVQEYGEFSPDNLARVQQLIGKTPTKPGEGDYTLGPNQVRFTADGKIVARGPTTRGGGGDDAEKGPTASAKATAERWKQDALAKAEDDFKAAWEQASLGETDPDPAVRRQAKDAKATLLRAHNARKGQIQQSYQTQLGMQMSDLVSPDARRASAPPPSGPSVPPPATPFGAAPANAAPASRPMPKVGDVVTVRGQRVRITQVTPDGQIEGVPVP